MPQSLPFRLLHRKRCKFPTCRLPTSYYTTCHPVSELLRCAIASYNTQRTPISRYRVKDTATQNNFRLNPVTSYDWLLRHVSGVVTYRLREEVVWEHWTTIRPDKQRVYVHPPGLPTSGTIWHGVTSKTTASTFQRPLRSARVAMWPWHPCPSIYRQSIMGPISNLATRKRKNLRSRPIQGHGLPPHCDGGQQHALLTSFHHKSPAAQRIERTTSSRRFGLTYAFESWPSWRNTTRLVLGRPRPADGHIILRMVRRQKDMIVLGEPDAFVRLIMNREVAQAAGDRVLAVDDLDIHVHVVVIRAGGELLAVDLLGLERIPGPDDLAVVVPRVERALGVVQRRPARRPRPAAS